MGKLSLIVMCVAAWMNVGCVKSTRINGVFSTDEKRIWIVRVSDEKDAAVFRCADGAPPEQPPKPVCVRAPFVDHPQ